MFGFGKKEPKPIKYPTWQTLEHFEGLADFGWGDLCTVDILPQEHELKFSWKRTEIRLPFKQIEAVRLITWRKQRTRHADAAGRAFVGGLIGGNSGFALGALSAQNEMVTRTVRIDPALEIVYSPRGAYQDTQHIIFGEVDPFSSKKIRLFSEAICHYIGLDGPEIVPDKPQPKYL